MNRLGDKIKDGWKISRKKLRNYGLEPDWNVIKQKTDNEGRNSVKMAVLKKNGEKLLENCQTMGDDGLKIHTKTRHIYEALSSEVYKAEPKKMIIEGNKQRTRTIFMSQNGMLECGKNMRGTIPEKCPQCDILDDENHRLNYCPK